MALAHPDLTDWPDVAEALLEDTDRLQTLATDLLLLARLDAGEQASVEAVDLGELVHEVVGRSPGTRVPSTCASVMTWWWRGPLPARAGQPPRQRPAARHDLDLRHRRHPVGTGPALASQPRWDGADTRSEPSGIRHRRGVQ